MQKRTKVIIGVVAVVLVACFFIPFKNTATMGDLRGYSLSEYDVVNGKVVDRGANFVDVRVFAEPKDFIVRFAISTSDDIITGESALILRGRNDPLDGSYQYNTKVALPKNSNLLDSALEMAGIRTTSVYEGKIVEKRQA